MTRPLWITADDYGLGPGINEGIEELAAAGHVDAVTIMLHQDAVLDTVGRLPRTGAKLGPHLVFVEERPLLPARELGPLVDDAGRLPKDHKSLFAKLVRHPGAAQLFVREAEAQLARFAGLGIACDFVTSHQHVHLSPPLFRALAPLFATLRGARVRAAIAPGGSLKSVALYAASRASLFLESTDQDALLHPAGLEASGHLDEASLARALSDLERVSLGGATPEIVTHPGRADAATARRYAHWGYAWDQEREMLAGSGARELADRYRRGTS